MFAGTKCHCMWRLRGYFFFWLWWQNFSSGYGKESCKLQWWYIVLWLHFIVYSFTGAWKEWFAISVCFFVLVAPIHSCYMFKVSLLCVVEHILTQTFALFLVANRCTMCVVKKGAQMPLGKTVEVMWASFTLRYRNFSHKRRMLRLHWAVKFLTFESLCSSQCQLQLVSSEIMKIDSHVVSYHYQNAVRNKSHNFHFLIQEFGFSQTSCTLAKEQCWIIESQCLSTL